MIPERICHYSNVGCGYSCDFCWEMNTVNGWFSENECFDSVLRLLQNIKRKEIKHKQMLNIDRLGRYLKGS